MYGTKVIKGVEYVSFSVEMAQFGGMSKADAKELLKEAGIKFSFSDAYTPFVGHWAVWIEKSRSDDAEKILF